MVVGGRDYFPFGPCWAYFQIIFQAKLGYFCFQKVEAFRAGHISTNPFKKPGAHHVLKPLRLKEVSCTFFQVLKALQLQRNIIEERTDFVVFFLNMKEFRDLLVNLNNICFIGWKWCWNTVVSAAIFWSNDVEQSNWKKPRYFNRWKCYVFHIMIGNHLTETSMFKVDALGTRMVMVCTRYPYQFPIKASISKQLIVNLAYICGFTPVTRKHASVPNRTPQKNFDQRDS